MRRSAGTAAAATNPDTAVTTPCSNSYPSRPAASARPDSTVRS
jgi:hypothetical protein